MLLPFHLLKTYSSLQVLFMGSLTALSFTVTGLWLLERMTEKKIPLYISLPAGVLLGIHVFSVLIQLLGFANIAILPLLRLIWFAQVVFAIGAILTHWDAIKYRVQKYLIIVYNYFSKGNLLILCALILAFLILLTLLVSLAPSTKIDELYYHMLVPLRLLQDSALQYYREPWPAMMPHMHFQITAAPLYALGVVDAFNVTSWWLGAILAWFCAAIVFQKTRDGTWALLVAVGMYAGMYTPVWFVTGGTGAVSVLSMAVLTFVTLDREEMIGRLGGLAFVPLVSILSMALAASKLAYVPFALLCLMICSFSVWRGFGYKRTFKIALLACSSWILFYLPALIWTWASSGYPLGVMQDPDFADKIASTRLIYHSLRGFFTQVATHIADHTPLVWGGCLLFIISPRIRKNRSVWPTGIAMLLFQGIVIGLTLPLTPRFLGGLPHGVALYFWMDAARNAPACLSDLFESKRIKAVLLALMAPWVFIQLYYSAQFLPIVVGAETAESFAERLIPMYEDFRELDKMLPKDATFFVEDFSIGSVYAPRPVIFDKRDLRGDFEKGTLYLLYRTPDSMKMAWGECSVKSIYNNDTAKIFTFRTPGRAPTLGPLTVYQLE